MTSLGVTCSVPLVLLLIWLPGTRGVLADGDPPSTIWDYASSYVEGAGADPLVEPVYAKDLICRAIADRERTEDNRGALGKDQFCFRNSHGAYAHDIVRSKDLLVYRRWLAFVKEGNTQSWMHLFDLLYSLKHTEAHHRSNYVAQKTVEVMNGAAELTKGERMDLDHILTLVDDAKRDANNLVKGFIAYDAVREWIVATSGSRTQASRSEPQRVPEGADWAGGMSAVLGPVDDKQGVPGGPDHPFSNTLDPKDSIATQRTDMEAHLPATSTRSTTSKPSTSSGLSSTTEPTTESNQEAAVPVNAVETQRPSNTRRRHWYCQAPKQKTPCCAVRRIHSPFAAQTQ
ncbi:unnamed protein product (mitochondrion) [Plasmodiophora brassicae]|uniref:Uncharacterized protein n=1 Tax=Plasmodiophora brassicae TaxID=37360 RepID=A0A3P3YP86_PLABS|nr:unnamed protein product [Plasmodiophora brassicae]